MTELRKDDRKQLGKLGEELAEVFLSEREYRIVDAIGAVVLASLILLQRKPTS